MYSTLHCSEKTPLFKKPERSKWAEFFPILDKYLHSIYLHTKFSQSDNNSKVPTCLRVQCTFSASVPVFTTTSVPGFAQKQTATIRVLKVIPDLSVTLSNCLSSSKRKHENKLTAKVSCFVSSSDQNSFYFLHSPGRSQMAQHAPIKRIHNCSSKPRILPDASEKSKPTFPNRRYLQVISLSVRCQPTVSTPSSHRAFSAMTVPISLSQHSST